MNTARIINTALLSVAVLGLAACADSEYSNYACHLVINNQNLKNSMLGSAMTQESPGIFCRISMEGTTRFRFESNQSSEPSYSPMSAVDQKANWAIGIYNAVIVGFGSLDGKFHAYDNQCPNCYESSGLPRYSLTMNTNGTATCKSCHRSYDMNNDGNLISGDKGKGLIRYRATTTGPLGVLSVNN